MSLFRNVSPSDTGKSLDDLHCSRFRGASARTRRILDSLCISLCVRDRFVDDVIIVRVIFTIFTIEKIVRDQAGQFLLHAYQSTWMFHENSSVRTRAPFDVRCAAMKETAHDAAHRRAYTCRDVSLGDLCLKHFFGITWKRFWRSKPAHDGGTSSPCPRALDLT